MQKSGQKENLDVVFQVKEGVAGTVLRVGNKEDGLSAIGKFWSQTHPFVVGIVLLADKVYLRAESVKRSLLQEAASVPIAERKRRVCDGLVCLQGDDEQAYVASGAVVVLGDVELALHHQQGNRVW